MGRLQGRIAVVTGAGRGIGREIALLMAAEGAKVVVNDLGANTDGTGATMIADEVVAEIKAAGGEAVSNTDSVADVAGGERLVQTAIDAFGGMDILVNNAGISQRCLAIDATPEIYTQLINIDLIAPIWLTQLQLSRMADAGGGHIVAISSVAGRIGAPLRTAYCAAKFGLIGYMDALRTEVDRSHNIKVTNILPGSVATDVSRNALAGDGSKRGVSDAVIDAGDAPVDCATCIWDAVNADTPEYIYAKEMEMGLAQMRHADPETFFAAISDLGAQTVEAYWTEQSDQH